MEEQEEILKLLQDEFGWKLTDSLTHTGKKLVNDTLIAKAFNDWCKTVKCSGPKPPTNILLKMYKNQKGL